MPESLTIMLPALFVGVGAGLGAVVFRKLIAGVQSISYNGIPWFDRQYRTLPPADPTCP